MNISTLKIFCDVVRFKSFSQSAQENGISQSAASQNVLQLEKSLGLKLIDRSKRPFQLTEEGQCYYQGCKELVERYFAVEDEVRNLRGEIRGTVRVAAIYSAGFSEISAAVQHFSRLHPQCNVTLSYLHPHRVHESVLEGEADLGLISYAQTKGRIVAVPWREEPMVVVAAPGHPLTEIDELAVDDLAGQRFIAFYRELAIRREIDRYLKDHETEVEVILSFDNAETIKRAVELGDAISILPEPIVSSELGAGTLVSLPLPKPGLKRPLGVISNQQRAPLRAAQQFIDLLHERAAEKVKIAA